MSLKDALVEMMWEATRDMSFQEIDTAVSAAWSEFEDKCQTVEQYETERGDHLLHMEREG